MDGYIDLDPDEVKIGAINIVQGYLGRNTLVAAHTIQGHEWKENSEIRYDITNMLRSNWHISGVFLCAHE